MDHGVARLLEHLGQEGEMDNLVAFYTSYQGFILGERDNRDKR